jgi:hypothetical protein
MRTGMTLFLILPSRVKRGFGAKAAGGSPSAAAMEGDWLVVGISGDSTFEGLFD